MAKDDRRCSVLRDRKITMVMVGTVGILRRKEKLDPFVGAEEEG